MLLNCPWQEIFILRRNSLLCSYMYFARNSLHWVSNISCRSIFLQRRKGLWCSIIAESASRLDKVNPSFWLAIWLYRRLRYTIHGGAFFLSYLLAIFWFSIDLGLRSFFLKVEYSLLSAYGKSWITWERHFQKHLSRASLLALA